jgi:thiamine-monophosphate kinase
VTLLVRDLDEAGLLARLTPVLPSGDATLLGTGDDSAVVAAPDGRVVVSTDVLVEDVHFRREWSSGYDVGWRAAMQNLADIAAMGARPTAIVVGLVVPGDLPVSWAEDFARGLAEACAPVGVGVVGGDLSSGPVVMVSVAVHGSLDGRAPVLRSGARPGDVVAHAGVLGYSAAGLALLTAAAAGPNISGELTPFVVGYLRPAPPLARGPVAGLAGATALIDVSDGLLRDAGRIADASRVVIDLSAAALAPAVAVLRPVCAALDDVRLALDFVLTGGEDHGLLATFPADAPLPEGFVGIGTVRPGAPGVTLDGAPPPANKGWDHFRG